VKSLNDLADDADDRVEFQAAWAVSDDGGKSRITSRPKPAGTGFGESDTVVVWEIHSYPRAARGSLASVAAGAASMDRDSSLRVSWIVPGNLADPADDQVVWWSEQIWYKQGGDLAYTSEEFTPKSPIPCGADPGAGTLVREEKYPDAGADRRMTRLWRRDVFDPAEKAWTWDGRRYFSNGDSTTETGSLTAGTGVYANGLGKPEPSDGSTPTPIASATPPARGGQGEGARGCILRAGTYRNQDGTANFTSRLSVGEGDSSATRTIIAPEENGGRRVAVRAGGDSSVYTLKGDSACWTKRQGDTTFVFRAFAGGDGSRAVSQTVADGKGAALVRGEFEFRPDGFGSRSLKVSTEGRNDTVEFRFRGRWNDADRYGRN